MELGIILWLMYGILIYDMPIIAANAVAFIFGTMNLVMKLRYG